MLGRISLCLGAFLAQISAAPAASKCVTTHLTPFNIAGHGLTIFYYEDSPYYLVYDEYDRGISNPVFLKKGVLYYKSDPNDGSDSPSPVVVPDTANNWLTLSADGTSNGTVGWKVCGGVLMFEEDHLFYAYDNWNIGYPDGYTIAWAKDKKAIINTDPAPVILNMTVVTN